MAPGRRLFGILLVLCGLPGPALCEPIDIAASAIAAFDPRDPEQARFGALTFLGGLELTSPDPRFGGFSGAEIAPDGGRIALVSDRGYFISASLVYDGGRPAALSEARIDPLTDERGVPFGDKFDSDAEGLRGARGVGLAGEVLISFEREHRILGYRLQQDGAPEMTDPVPLPSETVGLPHNQGIEAIAVIPPGTARAGAVIAVAENGPEEGSSLIPGWILEDGSTAPFWIERSDDFKVTDAVALPDGGLLLLERRLALLTALSMRIRHIAADDIEAEAVLAGTPLITASMAYQVDNMEGIAVHRDAAGRTVLTIVSDDNFNAFQRTILLQFAIR